MEGNKSYPTQPRIPDELWEELVRAGQCREFAKGEFLYWHDKPCTGIYCVERGHVRVFQFLDNGAEAVLMNVMSHYMVGEISALDGTENTPAAVALTPVRAYFLSVEQVWELIDTNRAFSRFLVSSLVHKLRILTLQVGTIAGKRVFGRLAANLSMLPAYGLKADQSGWYTVTHAELAGIIGTTRPNVTAALNQLAQQDVVELRRNMLRVLDPERLAELAEYDE